MTTSHLATHVERQQVPATSLPLSGIRIIDATHALAGPFATMILADMGAEVVKVEPPGGCETRRGNHEINGTSLFFLENNRNKRSIVINLKSEQGKEVFYDLVRTGDVVIYNFSPGVAERLKIDHDSLLKINPRIVTCSVTGFGDRGQLAKARAMDLVVQSTAGAVSITGEPGHPPVKAGVPTADLSTGLYSCIGILSALRDRDRTGRGLKVETSLFHSQLTLLNPIGPYALFTGQAPGQVGNRDLTVPSSRAYKTKDGTIAVMAHTERHFEGLFGAFNRLDLLKDPRFSTKASRMQNQEELRQLIANELQHKTNAEWLALLLPRGVACGPVNNVLEALRHPQAAEYKAVRRTSYRNKEVEVLGTPIWFNGYQGHPVADPPAPGEHTVQILSDVLAYDGARIRRLFESGAVEGIHPDTK